MNKDDYNKQEFYKGWPKGEVFYDLLPGCPLNPSEYKGDKDCAICLGVGQVCVMNYNRNPPDFMLPCDCMEKN